MASGVSSTIISTPVAASRALMLRPSLPIIRPFTSSDSILNTETQLSTASSVPMRWIVLIIIFLAINQGKVIMKKQIKRMKMEKQ